MARRRHRRHHSSRKHSIGNMLGRFIEPASFGVAFVSQVSQKDIASYPNFSTLSGVEKLKFLGNSIAGRTTGINPFPQYGKNNITINPSGIINKFTGLGIALWAVGEFAPSSLGHKSAIKRVGKGMFWGGVFGGLFDDPLPRMANRPLQSAQIGSGNSMVQNGSMLAPS